MENLKTTWTERIAVWRASGLSAEKFVADKDFSVASLFYWVKRLGLQRKKKNAPFPMARVVSPTSVAMPSAHAPQNHGIPLVLEHSGVRISIHRGFDRQTLTEVLDLLTTRRGAR